MDNLLYSKAPVFDGIEGFCHGFFQRHHGVGEKPFDSLNISFDVGDKTDFVVRNRKLILKEFGFHKMVAVNQTHGLDFYEPGPLDGVFGEHSKSKQDADIIITDNPGQLLLIKTADCQPIIIADPEKRVCAAVHSGWKGSVVNVICRAVDTMMKDYDCDPENMLAAVGPALGSCCAEFINYRKEIPEKYWKFRVGEYNFDFRAISKQQLENAGLKSKNIWIDQNCTKCNPDKYFSYRNNKITGRQACVAGWLN